MQRLLAFLCTCLLAFVALVLPAQNLVPNPGFEQLTGCPTVGGQIALALSWINPTPGGFPNGSPDFFHDCSAEMGVPVNFAGTQAPLSGLGYAGFHPYSSAAANFREYVEVHLTEPLVPDKCYELSFHVSLGDKMLKAVCNLGALFRNSMISQPTAGPLPFTPSLDGLGGCITDQENWTLVSGVYTAQGGESYLIVGNFHDDASTTAITVNPNAAYLMSYYYIDDVSVSEIADAECLSLGVEEQVNSSVSLFPNPANDRLTITTGRSEKVVLAIRDPQGSVMLQERFTRSTTIDIGQIATGIYTAEIIDGDGIATRQRFIKQ